MLEVSVRLIHGCVRLPDPAIKSHFLVPNLWQHIYPFSATRKTLDVKHFSSFLALVHMHGLVSDGTNRSVTIDQFPQLNRDFEDIKYINHLWHTAQSAEETKVLGDFLAVTGGAAVHAALLSDLVADLNTIISNENKEKIHALFGNLNNIALQSSAFAEEICRSGLLTSLEKILNRSGLDLKNITDAVC